jgi:ubiquinone/menaquinone biosynthesis C-methylase UbiE
VSAAESTSAAGWPTHLGPVADRLCCPACRAALRHEGERLHCTACNEAYPLLEGVPLLAIEGTVEGWAPGAQVNEDSSEYQQAYREVEEAEFYNREYQERLLKRWSTAAEYRLLDRLLGSQGRSEVILDLPSGGGRLSPRIAAHADLLIEADIALGQVLYGKRQSPLDTPQIWMTASAFHIPLRDDAVDGTVCPRLCHHLPSAAERERLIEELLRVSRRFVVMTFFDYYSLKNWLRRLRAPFNKKPPKMTMTVQRVRELAEANGARLVTCPMLSPTSSGHRYALMVKD